MRSVGFNLPAFGGETMCSVGWCFGHDFRTISSFGLSRFMVFDMARRIGSGSNSIRAPSIVSVGFNLPAFGVETQRARRSVLRP